jgi:anti-anti-sigma factor
MVVNGSLSKTAVNGGAGAKSQVSAVVVAVLTIVTLLFLTGLFEDLPEATLAAVVIAALVELVDVRSLIRLYRLHTRGLGRLYGVASRPDFIAALAALLGVLVFDTLPGLFIGIVVSLLLLVYRASRPHVSELGRVRGADEHYADMETTADSEAVPGISVLRIESGLFFANADLVRESIRDHAAAPGTRAIVLDAETMPYIDVTAVDMLLQVAEELRRSNVELAIARDIGQVHDILRVGDVEGPIRTYPTLRAAVAALSSDTGRSSR